MKPETPTPDKPKRPDVAIRQRLLDACVGKPAKIPWPHRLLHDAADHIEKLEACKWDVQHTDAMNDMVALGIDRDSWKARVEALEAGQVKLEAVVEAARAMDAGWRGVMPDRAPGYYCEFCGEGHVERPKILHSALCKIFQFNEALAALGDGDG